MPTIKRIKLQGTRFSDSGQWWLMKSEPQECSIDDLSAAPNQTVPWIGVRNYQARNFMRDQMRVGDGVFFYHSSCAEPGIAGLAQVASQAYPDASQFVADSPYFDAKATLEKPRWLHVDIRFVCKTELLSIKQMRTFVQLEQMQLLRPGNRLSITPVSTGDWQFLLGLLRAVT